MKKITIILTILLLSSPLIYAQKNVGGWDPDKPEKPTKAEKENQDYEETIKIFKEKIAGIDKFFDNAYGYVVFSNVGKGGFIVGGGYGKGRVYQGGNWIGTSELVQGSVGFQIGGEAYREIIFFKDQKALDIFKEGKLKFSSQASAVAVTAGVSVDLAYNDGVAVFTLTKGGLMASASVGGQSFSYKPK